MKSYVLISPVRNEEIFIEKTILSVVNQTQKPLRWVIVSDASTDRTDEIVKDYANHYSFIVFVRKEKKEERNFASKVYAIQEGYKHLEKLSYDFIGNLDGDVSFDENYYQTIIERMNLEPRLGIAGGHVYDLVGEIFVPEKTSFNSVAGAIQFFRRECYEDIGGYRPMPYGGVDAAAEIYAKMKGWGVKTFPDLKIYHHRRVGTAKHGFIKASFKRGMMFFTLGYHPFFEFMRCVARIFEKPYFLSSFLEYSGYLWAKVKGKNKQLPPEVITYLRKEQIKRFLLMKK